MADLLSEDELITSPPSDHNDSTYSEQRIQHPMITPEQRKGPKEQFSDAAKKRVGKATENLTKLRCLITNAPELYSVEYAHVMPRSTDPDTLKKLEYSWGMRFGTFNVDTRYNVIRLNSVLHSLFDNGLWILLPEEVILDQFLNRQERPDESFMTFVRESKTYKYQFIPARNLNAFELRRYSAPMDPRQTAGPANFDPSYYYPFDNFPIITSHVHPHFVIYNIGLKMQKHLRNFFGIDESHRRMIEKAIDIFDKWTEDIPIEANFDRDPFSPDNNDDNDSAFTKEGRRDTRAFRRSLHPPETPSNRSSRSRKRARVLEETDGLWLDDETLRVLDDDSSPRSRLKRKKRAISSWISNVSKVEFDTIDCIPTKFIPHLHVLRGITF